MRLLVFYLLLGLLTSSLPASSAPVHVPRDTEVENKHYSSNDRDSLPAAYSVPGVLEVSNQTEVW